MPVTGVEVFGRQPSLEGTRLETLTIESFVSSGELLSSANVVYLRSDSQWYRFAIDHGTIHWRTLAFAPEPLAPIGEFEYPWRSMDRELELPATVRKFDVSGQWPTVRVQFTLENGHTLIVHSLGETNSYHAA